MNRMVVKIAASSFVIGVTTVGCQQDGRVRPQGVTQAQGRTDQEAARFARDAANAAVNGDRQNAIAAMERAVALSPRDAGYRQTLAELYMRSGRFGSAETTYGDVLSIDPSNARAGMSRALMLAASGRRDQALAQLESLEGLPASDVGLAFALAGAPQRAIAILEPAARGANANARIRQNLALAYALSGDWQQARNIASQDLSPGEVPQRMAQWAQLASADGAGTQVAALIGVEQVEDAGQPTQLALNGGAAPTEVGQPIRSAEAPAEVQVAAADPAPVPVPVAGEAVVQTASLDPESLPMPTDSRPAADGAPVEAPAVQTAEIHRGSVPADAYAELETPEWGVEGNGNVRLPAPDAEEAAQPVRVRYAAATQQLVRPDALVMRRAPQAMRRTAAASSWRNLASEVPAGEGGGSGRYVVQLGAFSNVENAERAWQEAQHNYGLAERAPVTMTVDMNGRLLHRVAVAGFDSRGAAARLCGSIRARGGECFVRLNAGDAAVRWAARYTGNPRADRLEPEQSLDRLIERSAGQRRPLFFVGRRWSFDTPVRQAHRLLRMSGNFVPAHPE